MLDEETGAEPRVISASISDPYLLLVRDDNSVVVAQIDSNNELEEVDKTGNALLSTKWQTGCLYNDTKGTFHSSAGDKGVDTSGKVMMFLLSSTGALHVSSSVSSTVILLTTRRSMLFLTFPNQSTLPKASAMFLPMSLQDILLAAVWLVRTFAKSLLQTLAILFLKHHISS